MGTQSVATAANRRYSGFDGQYINGSWRPGRQGRTLKDTDPYSGETLAEIALASQSDLDEAYRSAAKAQAAWAASPPSERASVMYRAAALMDARHEEIIDWLIRESGSTRVKAETEWRYTHSITLEAATFPRRLEGRLLPVDDAGIESRAYRQPLGVIGVISPWNFPLYLSQRSVGPALALGNAVVVKPSRDTPVTGGLLLAKIYEEAGLPPRPAQRRGRRFRGHRRRVHVAPHPAPHLVHGIHPGRPPDRGAGGHGTDDEAGRARTRGQLALRGPGRRGPGADRTRRRSRQVRPPGTNLREHESNHRGRVAPRRVRGPIRRPRPPVEGRQPRRPGHDHRPGDQQEATRVAPGPHRGGSRFGGTPEAGRGSRGSGAAAARVRGRHQRHAGRPGGDVRPDRAGHQGQRRGGGVAGRERHPVRPFERRVHPGHRPRRPVRPGRAGRDDSRQRQQRLRRAERPFGGEKNSGLGRFGGEWILREFTADHWVTVQHSRPAYPFGPARQV